jgi:hypothetical protein
MIHRFLFLLFLVLTARGMCQGGDGFTAQEAPGIALVKPQAWSKESAATILEFEALTDRRAQGSATAGYIEFRMPSGQARQVDASRIVKIIIFPDAGRIHSVVEEADRDRIAATLAEIDAVAQRFPATHSHLAPRVRDVAALIDRFDAGEVKIDGKWLPRRTYQEDQAASIAEILTVEIEKAEPPSSLDLQADPKFRTLEALGQTAPGAKSLVAKLKKQHTTRVHAEKRKKIIEDLADPSLGIEAARGLVAELDGLAPGDDPRAQAELDRWRNADLEAGALAKLAGPLADRIEVLLAEVTDFSVPPSLDPPTAEAADALARRFRVFQQANPPPQLRTLAAKAEAVATTSTTLEKLGPLFQDKRFLDAKTLLDDAAAHAAAVGPATARVITELQKLAAAQIELFSRAREDAATHESAGRPAEALAKYKEAYGMIPNAAVAQRIEALEAPEQAPEPVP